MAKGTVLDPRMNAQEKDFGILIISDDGNGRCKEIVYLKDRKSRTFTFGTPVDFNIDEVELENQDQEKKKMKIARAISVNDSIKDHPVTNNLNVYSQVLFDLKDDGRGDRLAKLNEIISREGGAEKVIESVSAVLNELIDKEEPDGK